LQEVYPLLQAYPHELPAQVGSACAIVVVHWLVHMPQLFGSVVVSTQLVPHSVGVGAMHPDVHEYVVPLPEQSGVPPLHMTPHMPQLVFVETCVSQPPEVGPLQCA
jgi:hypothetical protein